MNYKELAFIATQTKINKKTQTPIHRNDCVSEGLAVLTQALGSVLACYPCELRKKCNPISLLCKCLVWQCLFLVFKKVFWIALISASLHSMQPLVQLSWERDNQCSLGWTLMPWQYVAFAFPAPGWFVLHFRNLQDGFCCVTAAFGEILEQREKVTGPQGLRILNMLSNIWTTWRVYDKSGMREAVNKQ